MRRLCPPKPASTGPTTRIGVVSILAGEGHKFPGFSLSLWGDVPLGSGLSSSAALEVVTALAVLSLIGVNYPGPRARPALPARGKRICRRKLRHHGPVHLRQRQKDHALLLDCRDLSFKLAPIPAHVALVIANTMVKHSVAGGDYTTRRAEVEAACAVIASHRPEVRFLRDATVEDLEKWGHEMTPNSLKRARHVVTENLRTRGCSRGAGCQATSPNWAA